LFWSSRPSGPRWSCQELAIRRASRGVWAVDGHPSAKLHRPGRYCASFSLCVLAGTVVRGGRLLAALGRFFRVDVALKCRIRLVPRVVGRDWRVRACLQWLKPGRMCRQYFGWEFEYHARNAKEAAGGKDAQKVGGLEGFGHAVVLVGARGALVLFRKLPSLYCRRLIGLWFQYFDNGLQGRILFKA
jgi:hypothetical protein